MKVNLLNTYGFIFPINMSHTKSKAGGSLTLLDCFVQIYLHLIQIARKNLTV